MEMKQDSTRTRIYTSTPQVCRFESTGKFVDDGFSESKRRPGGCAALMRGAAPELAGLGPQNPPVNFPVNIQSRNSRFETSIDAPFTTRCTMSRAMPGTASGATPNGTANGLISPSNPALLLANLRLLDLDLHTDWPGITIQALSTRDQKQRIRCVEWALFRLFELWDPEETRDVSLNRSITQRQSLTCT